MPSIHQVNHPGREQNISYRSRKNHEDDYEFYKDSTTQGIRFWNRCKIIGRSNSHKRKFMEVKGKYRICSLCFRAIGILYIQKLTKIKGS